MNRRSKKKYGGNCAERETRTTAEDGYIDIGTCDTKGSSADKDWLNSGFQLHPRFYAAVVLLE